MFKFFLFNALRIVQKSKQGFDPPTYPDEDRPLSSRIFVCLLKLSFQTEAAKTKPDLDRSGTRVLAAGVLCEEDGLTKLVVANALSDACPTKNSNVRSFELTGIACQNV